MENAAPVAASVLEGEGTPSNLKAGVAFSLELCAVRTVTAPDAPKVKGRVARASKVKVFMRYSTFLEGKTNEKPGSGKCGGREPKSEVRRLTRWGRGQRWKPPDLRLWLPPSALA